MSAERFLEILEHGQAPDIAIRFKRKPGTSKFPDEHSYRVTGWYKMVDPEVLKSKSHKDDWISGLLVDTAHKRDGKLIMHCTREEATHVGGAGVGGCLVAVKDIICGGYVDWPQEIIDKDRERALRCVGEYVS